jgi:hypothetical protein
MQIDSRIVESRTPIFWRMSGGTPEWVILAGRLASDSVPPRLTASLKDLQCVQEFEGGGLAADNVERKRRHCTPQPPLVTEALSHGHAVELPRLREFL